MILNFKFEPNLICVSLEVRLNYLISIDSRLCTPFQRTPLTTTKMPINCMGILISFFKESPLARGSQFLWGFKYTTLLLKSQ